MGSILGYHRPAALDEALALLATDATSVVIGGGTGVIADPGTEGIEVVDLQALGLDRISVDDISVRIGATARLQDVVDSAAVPRLIRDAARREAPSTIRNAATIGGAVATGDADSGLVAALLVHEATVELARPSGTEGRTLPDLLEDRSILAGAVITAVTVVDGGASAWAGTGRTPADTPIVAAYARRTGGGALLALTGVAATPVLIDRSAVDSLDPPGDFRGTPEYRRALAHTLADRALASVEVGR